MHGKRWFEGPSGLRGKRVGRLDGIGSVLEGSGYVVSADDYGRQVMG